ncbi:MULTISPECIES: hypothetical protein [Streptomyces]|uniref:hypothetical protein n=1 Tax=Streptomyces TaxID=1883 RepID=UPI00159F0AAC|nr:MULTISPECIES: hypothetical protein [Streptomyces]MCW8219624.1 hypothetical protein [Streptomyces griseolus]
MSAELLDACHLGVKRPQILGLQTIELVGSDAGHELDTYVDFVAVIGVLADVLLSDALDPVLKPDPERPHLAGLPNPAGDTLPSPEPGQPW